MVRRSAVPGTLPHTLVPRPSDNVVSSCCGVLHLKYPNSAVQWRPALALLASAAWLLPVAFLTPGCCCLAPVRVTGPRASGQADRHRKAADVPCCLLSLGAARSVVCQLLLHCRLYPHVLLNWQTAVQAGRRCRIYVPPCCA